MRRWRGRLPRRRQPSGAFGAQDDRPKRLENSARDRGRESGCRWNRFRCRRQRTTVVSRSLGDPRPGRAVLVTMKGTRLVLALHACVERRLPPGTQPRGAVCEREHANNRCHPFQDRPHASRMRRCRRRVKRRWSQTGATRSFAAAGLSPPPARNPTARPQKSPAATPRTRGKPTNICGFAGRPRGTTCALTQVS